MQREETMTHEIPACKIISKQNATHYTDNYNNNLLSTVDYGVYGIDNFCNH